MIATLAPVIAGTVKTMALSFLSEKLLIKVVFLLLEKLVQSAVSANTTVRCGRKLCEKICQAMHVEFSRGAWCA